MNSLKVIVLINIFSIIRKEQLQKQREYLKQKKQKKLVKMKELEEAREAEKSKWQTFNAKVHNLFSLLQLKKFT